MSRKNENNKSGGLSIGPLSGHLWERVVNNDEIRDKGGSLKIRLCVRADHRNGNSGGVIKAVVLKQAVVEWQESSKALRESMSGLFGILEDVRVMRGDK